MNRKKGINLGRPDKGYFPYCWFGRPIVLAAFTGRQGIIDADEVLTTNRVACSDGLMLRMRERECVAGALGQLAQKIAAQPESSIWFEVPDLTLFDAIDTMLQNCGPGYYRTIVSTDPRVLLHACEARPDLEIALRVETEKDLAKLERCPYSAIVMVEALATHDRIHRIENSGKGVAIELRHDEPETLSRRVRWLAHENVDVLITHDAPRTRAAIA